MRSRSLYLWIITIVVVPRPTIWGWGSVLDHLGGAVSGDGRPELVRQTGARPHIYNFAPVPSLAPLVPSSSRGKTPLAHRWKYACKVLWSRALFRPRLLAGVEARLVEALVMAKALAAAAWVASLEPELAPSHSCSCPSTCSRMVSVCIPSTE